MRVSDMLFFFCRETHVLLYVLGEPPTNWLKLRPWSTDEDSLRTRELILEYDQVDFPKDTDRFGELVIYMRNDSNDTTAT